MNSIWRFTINPNSKKSLLVSDESQFIDELKITKEIWYEFPHYYSWEDIIWYRAAVIETEANNIDSIKKIYKIEPNKVYKKVKKHLIFYFKKSLNKFDYNRISKALAFLYDWEAIDYHFYPENWVTTEYSSNDINDNLITTCTKIYFFRSKENEYHKSLTIHEYDRYLECNKLPISDVLSILYWKDVLTLETLKEWIDEKHNIHKDYWYPFDLVNKYFWSIEKAKEFFNNNFKIEFDEINSFDYTRARNWVVITSWENLFINNLWYFTLDPAWNQKKLTDFYIKVHSKIVWNEWKHHFIVSLVNESEWIETKKMIWENKTSVWTFSDFIQSYWPFHYYWPAPFIKELHRQISTTRQVPTVKQVVWYWHHKDDWIIIFKNWIWDIKERLFTTKLESDDDFYYNYNGSWYWVTDKQWNNLSVILTDWVPSLNINKVLELDEILDFMDTLYADNSWKYLMFLAFGMIWYLLYWDQTKPFPLIFTRGTTWSGKSEFNGILQKIWGIKKTWSDFENSTLFTMTVTLSYLIKFPYFIAEYREAATHRLQKVWTLRSVFDKISQTKWRADQSVVKYDYVAVPVLDWEEMITDWALRTRSVQCQLLNKHKISWNFNKILREGWWLLDNILFTYLTKSSWEKYNDFLDEWYELFKPMTTQNRIAQNMANLYAWCMCFSEEQKEMYLMVLEWILKFQEEDVLQNSTSMQIIKVISKFMENSYNWVYVREKDVIISWNALEEYVNRYRVDTTLKINSYKEHLATMGFDIDFVEVNEQLIEWIIVPFSIIPKNLLVEPRVYQSYKDWINKNNKHD